MKCNVYEAEYNNNKVDNTCKLNTEINYSEDCKFQKIILGFLGKAAS